MFRNWGVVMRGPWRSDQNFGVIGGLVSEFISYIRDVFLCLFSKFFKDGADLISDGILQNMVPA